MRAGGSALDDAAALARYRQAALVGIGSGGAADLAPLAWLAARGRFGRPPAPPLVEAALWPQDARAVVPGAARAPMRALLAGRDARADGPYARRIAQEMQGRALRPHPFDLKALESFVGRHAGRLGRHAQAWLAIVRPVQAETREPYAEDVEALSEASFAAASRAEKLAFLRNMRHGDPAAARAFIASRLESEAAIVRAGMVDVLALGLGPDDSELLASLAEDRAASVRDAAAAMLARVPGTPAYEARKRDAAIWLEVKSKGLLGRTRTIQVKAPGTLPPDRLDAAFAAAFEGVALADIAAPLGLSLADFAAAARGEWRVARLALTRAVQEDRADLVAILTDGDTEEDDPVAVIAAALPAAPPARRAALVEAGVLPGRWASLPRRPGLEALHEALGGALPPAVATALLRSAAWAKAVPRLEVEDERAAPDIIESVAALMPLATAPAFLATLDALPAVLKRRPRLLFDCLETFSATKGAAP